jgi:hypothetical protein
LLEVGPEGFDRVEFRGIRGQEDGVKSAPPAEIDLDGSSAMTGKAIPHDQQGVAEMRGQIAQEGFQPRGSDVGVGPEGEVEPHPSTLRRN